MKKTIALGLLTLVAACAGQPKETYPYGMNEKEWNELSIKDKANIRREFYFYEKGSTAFINPQMEVEGKKTGNAPDYATAQKSCSERRIANASIRNALSLTRGRFLCRKI